MRFDRRWLPLFLLAGCGQPVFWHASFSARNGHPVLDTEEVEVSFDEISVEVPPLQDGGGATGSLQVSGPGASETTLTAFNEILTNRYERGENTVQLRNHKLRIVDEGRALLIGNERIDLRGPKKMLVVKEGDQVEIR